MKIFHSILCLCLSSLVSWGQTPDSFQVNMYKQFLNQKASSQLTEQLYNNRLFTKALLRESAQNTRKRIYASQDTTLIRQYEAWIAKRAWYGRLLDWTDSTRKRKGVDLAKLAQEVNNLEKNLQKGLLRKSTKFTRKLEEYVPHTWQEIQQKLKVGEVAIEIIRARQYDKKQSNLIYYTALVVTPKSTQPIAVFLKNGNALENQGLKEYLQSYGQDRVSFARFWQPIHAQLMKAYPAVKKVYLSSDGVYHRVNLETLRDLANNEFVFDKYDIQRVSNTKNILRRGKKADPSPKKQAVLVGLPSKELKEVQQLLQDQQWKVKTHTQAETIKDSLKQLKSPPVIHMATHGYYISQDSLKKLKNGQTSEQKYLQNPLFRAGLWWPKKTSKSIQNKEVLSAFEAQNLPLHQTDLVVLSADETALGLIQNGEGVYGLPRALHSAGAKYVLASFWKINREATQQLMQYFYRFHNEGKPYHQALRLAKQQLRKAYPHPKDWGAFVLLE
ncbi:MAG TPA: hypothetical protein DCS93_03280 [Microscillaceae bacterium]|nr:hypothetical protein [Microscillaceae bacterium]